MRATCLRSSAAALLDFAIRIAPPDSREWGQAMRSELDYVEDPWGALRWAVGGAMVLLRRALAALFTRSLGGENVPSGGGLFSRDVPLRRAALAAAGACLLAALMFFAAPPFRQALRVSYSPWLRMVQPYGRTGPPRLEELARRARRRRDGEGLAFCAIRLYDARESARVAEEAVRLDPKLLWVYAVVALHHPALPEIGEWLPKLERFDAQNALIPLIAAERNDVQRMSHKDGPGASQENDPAWRGAMAAAFGALSFHDYSDRARDLDRRVVLRYRFYDPEAVLLDLPAYSFGDIHRFACLLIRSGEGLEAGGDSKGAMEKYLAVARFGQLIESGKDTRFIGAGLQSTAYKQLQALSLRRGRTAEAALFGYLAAKFNPVSMARGPRGEWVFGLDICRRNAAFVQVSGLLILLFSALLAAAALMIVADRSAKPAALRLRRAVPVAGLIGGVGLLLSSATLYLTYRPYWYIFQGAVLNGDRSQIRDLRDFLRVSQIPLGFLGRVPMRELPVYFWAGVIFLCVVALALIFLRHVRPSPRAGGLQHHPHAP